MQVTIRLLASYRRFVPEGLDSEGGYPHEVPPRTTVGEILAELSLPQEDVITFLVNGRHATREQVLQAGDVLAVFPAVGGG
jgi:sulfur carrier protein ThiS